MLKNPNKYIRKAYITALSGIGVPVYDKRLPPDIEIPERYVLIQGQTKTETLRTKCGKCWQSYTNVDIFDRSNRGFADSSQLDDLEELITDALAPSTQTDLAVDNFTVYNTFVDESVDIPQEFGNETVLHRVLRFRIILG